MNEVTDALVYTELIQNTIGPAGFFNNPKNQTEYLANSSFLPKYNNQNTLDKSIKDRFSALEKICLTMFKKDTMLTPPSTAWFNYLGEDGKTLVPMTK